MKPATPLLVTQHVGEGIYEVGRLQLQWLLNPTVDMPKLHIQFFRTMLNDAGWLALQNRLAENK